MLYIGTGLVFMLLPGTFLGVWNLIRISSRAQAGSISASWIQAHGLAQLFGWIGTFILGIGFYSIPKLRRMERFALWTARTTWALWTTGVALRWTTNIYLWHWRVLVPLSALLQLVAFALFFKTVSGHKPAAASEAKKPGLEPWSLIVIGATIGMAASVLANVGGAMWQGLFGATPAFPPEFDNRFLVLTAWGFVVPFVWGFSAKWLPIFLGLRPTRKRLLASAAIINAVAVLIALFGMYRTTAVLLFAASVAAPLALRIFASPQQPAKVNGVHPTLPLFVRFAYAWSLVGASLAIWAAFDGNPAGVAGAGRHALTVGFMATMVFCVGQRVLPAFCGMRTLWSPRLMFGGLALLTTGCALRIVSEVLAYPGYFAPAWHWLPVSAVMELTAITVFAINLAATMLSTPPSARLVSIAAPAK